MTPSRRSFVLMWGAHGWLGIALGTCLFAMFFAGSLTLFKEDVALWEQPALRVDVPPGELARTDAVLERALGGETPRGPVSLELPHKGSPRWRASWEGADGTPRSVTLRATTLEPWEGPERSALAELLYEVHKLGFLPAGEYVGGLVAIALLLSLVSGVVIHLRAIPHALLRLRWGERLRVWLGDLHALLAVVTLPALLVFGLTGAYLGVHGGLWQLLAVSSMRANPGFLMEDWNGPVPDVAQLQAGGERLRVGALLERVQGEGLQPHFVELPGTPEASGWARIHSEREGAFFNTEMRTYALQGGRLLTTRSAKSGSVVHWTENVVTGLHYASFGGRGLKVAYAVLALAMAAVCLVGVRLWGERRAASARAAAAAGVAVSAMLALLVVTALTFAAQRAGALAGLALDRVLEPLFFGSWALLTLAAWRWRRPGSRAALALAAASYLGAPLLGAFSPLGSVGFVDGLLVALGAACAGGALWRRAMSRGPARALSLESAAPR
ncbi:MAG TPA: PepSY-associated TM helix domain-containing protein [Myxococcaceae bacterium]|jgi:uncharacterized iron-regulated membrane protein